MIKEHSAMKRKVFYSAAILLFATLFLVSGYNLIKVWSEYAQADALNKELQKQYVQHNSIPGSTNTASPEIAQKSKAPIQVDFDALLKENEDIVGWLYLPNSPVNYPVVQAEDNNKYLRRDLKGKYLSAGTLFVDYRNDPIGTDRNYIIYGHNMKNGSMFHCLTNYKKQSYYDEHPVFYFLTPDATYEVPLVAAVTVPSDGNIYAPNPDDATIADILASSSFQGNVEITDDDCLITFSTCSYEYEEARYIVIGKMIKQ